jgi:hypothetical protein
MAPPHRLRRYGYPRRDFGPGSPPHNSRLAARGAGPNHNMSVRPQHKAVEGWGAPISSGWQPGNNVVGAVTTTCRHCSWRVPAMASRPPLRRGPLWFSDPRHRTLVSSGPRGSSPPPLMTVGPVLRSAPDKESESSRDDLSRTGALLRAERSAPWRPGCTDRPSPTRSSLSWP